jgi:hypothetical protein
MKWDYNNSTNTIWTSFDYGEVEADTYEEARVKAINQLKCDLEKANTVLHSCANVRSFRIDMNFEQIEITLKE